MAPTATAVQGRAAFTHPNFVYYEVARFFIVVALEMQSVAVGWQVFSITHRALDLGLVGLAQFLPGFFLFLASGAAADRFDRRKLLSICYTGFALCSLLLLMLALRQTHTVGPIYAVLVLLGAVRSLSGPVSRALLPHTVPLEHFTNAVAWHSTIYQSATILGPAVGGVMYAAFHTADAVYAAALTGSMLALSLTLRLRFREVKREREATSLRSTLAGFRYVWKQKLLLALISLDMFAVLLGGAVALLPVYASDILKTGPWGLGLLRSAPGIGAAVMAAVRRAPAAALARGHRDDVGRGRLRHLHDSVRHLAQSDVVTGVPGATGGERHDQRHHSRHADPDCHAGCHARAR